MKKSQRHAKNNPKSKHAQHIIQLVASIRHCDNYAVAVTFKLSLNHASQVLHHVNALPRSPVEVVTKPPPLHAVHVHLASPVLTKSLYLYYRTYISIQNKYYMPYFVSVLGMLCPKVCGRRIIISVYRLNIPIFFQIGIQSCFVKNKFVSLCNKC